MDLIPVILLVGVEVLRKLSNDLKLSLFNRINQSKLVARLANQLSGLRSNLLY
jgi:hypothetical protein